MPSSADAAILSGMNRPKPNAPKTPRGLKVSPGPGNFRGERKRSLPMCPQVLRLLAKCISSRHGAFAACRPRFKPPSYFGGPIPDSRSDLHVRRALLQKPPAAHAGDGQARDASDIVLI